MKETELIKKLKELISKYRALIYLKDKIMTKCYTEQEVKEIGRLESEISTLESLTEKEYKHELNIHSGINEYKYYKCFQCGCLVIYEKGVTPYWVPIASAHQKERGSKLCRGKYIEISKEEYEKDRNE